MTQHNEDSFSTSFESMRIGTQYSDSSNDANVFPPYTMSYGQPSSHPLDSIGEYGMINYPMMHKFHSKLHIKCNKDFKQACGEPRISYSWRGRVYKSRHLCMACSIL